MPTLLLLQDLNVPAAAIRELIRRYRLPYDLSFAEALAEKSRINVEVVGAVNAPVDARVLDVFQNVRMVAVAFTGHEHVDKELCKKRGIKVYNVPAYATDSVAELTIGLAISLLRDIPRGDRECRVTLAGRDDWWKGFGPGSDLNGKTVGIVGLGTIGMRVAELFHAFKCSLIAWARDPAEGDERAKDRRRRFEAAIEKGGLGGELLPLDEVFARADIVTLHVALNDQTRGLVSQRQFNCMKPGACLINTARGGVIDEAALIEILADPSKGIRAALDVFDPEPLPADDPLLRLPNTILTPHIAYKTKEALERRARITIENIKDFLDHADDPNHWPPNRVA